MNHKKREKINKLNLKKYLQGFNVIYIFIACSILILLVFKLIAHVDMTGQKVKDTSR